MSRGSPSMYDSNQNEAFLVLCVVVLALLGASCSESAEDLTDAELRDRLVEVLTEDDTLTSVQANCVVDILIDSF
jgi:hypothetical protein